MDTPENENIIRLHLKNVTADAIVVVLEPWASEYTLQPDEAFDIVEKGGRGDHAVEIHIAEGRTTLFARERATMSVVKDGEVLL